MKAGVLEAWRPVLERDQSSWIMGENRDGESEGEALPCAGEGERDGFPPEVTFRLCSREQVIPEERSWHQSHRRCELPDIFREW